MDGYIKKSEAVDVIVKYPYDIAGKTATAIKMIEDLPSADVVPKSEYDAVVSAVDNSTKEFLKLHDEYQGANAEIERLKHILDCYALQYGTVKDQQDVIDKANQEFASEIFAELEKMHIHITNDFDLRRYEQFKKKYTGGEDKPAATEKKYFSPEDVAKMTHQEVREKYTAIRKSMERW